MHWYAKSIKYKAYIYPCQCMIEYIFLTNNESMQAYAEKKPGGNPITCTPGLFAHP